MHFASTSRLDLLKIVQIVLFLIFLFDPYILLCGVMSLY